MPTLLRSLLCLLPLVLAGCARAPGEQALSPKIQYEKYRLPNGLEVILAEDRRLPMVTVNLWYHVGPSNEKAGRTGFAHLFEHMMFQGSKNVPEDGHLKLLEGAGASDLNGTTDFDRTNYFETVPSNQLELALWLESDRMGFLLEKLDHSKLENQRDVVRNERRQSIEGAPYGLVEESLYHELYPAGHPYHARIIGSHADIEAARLADVRDFFREYYAPNNASIAIVGDIDKARTKALIAEIFRTVAVRPEGRARDRRDARADQREAPDGHRPRRAAARLCRVAQPRVLRARRCRCGRAELRARWIEVEPAVPEAGVREADRAGRQRDAAVDAARFPLQHRSHRAARREAGGSARGDRCGAAHAARSGARRHRGGRGAQHHRRKRRARPGDAGRRGGPPEPLQPFPRRSGLSLEGHRPLRGGQAAHRQVAGRIDAALRCARGRVRRARREGDLRPAAQHAGRCRRGARRDSRGLARDAARTGSRLGAEAARAAAVQARQRTHDPARRVAQAARGVREPHGAGGQRSQSHRPLRSCLVRRRHARRRDADARLAADRARSRQARRDARRVVRDRLLGRRAAYADTERRCARSP